jgi:hypothetical protein
MWMYLQRREIGSHKVVKGVVITLHVDACAVVAFRTTIAPRRTAKMPLATNRR